MFWWGVGGGVRLDDSLQRALLAKRRFNRESLVLKHIQVCERGGSGSLRLAGNTNHGLTLAQIDNHSLDLHHLRTGFFF